LLSDSVGLVDSNQVFNYLKFWEQALERKEKLGIVNCSKFEMYQSFPRFRKELEEYQLKERQ